MFCSDDIFYVFNEKLGEVVVLEIVERLIKFIREVFLGKILLLVFYSMF